MEVTLASDTFTVRPTDDQLSRTSIEFAALDGEVGSGTFVIPDPQNELTVSTGRQFRVDEGATLLTDGFILDQDRERGTEPQGREHTFGLQDANALLDGFRIARSRPAETDVERVLAFADADHPDWDTTWVLDENTITMPKKKYDSDGGWTTELIPDLIEFTGKTLFVHDPADGSARHLHYHVLNSGHGCGLSISDVPGAADHITVWEPWGPTRSRTSVDLRNDIKGRDQTGRTSILSDSGSLTSHDADGLQHQALVEFDAASQADLNVKTAAFLASQKDDLDTWTCQIGPLDEDALALIRVGDIITVTSAVMGLTAAEKRISHLTLTPAIGNTAIPDRWMATLEMGAPKRRRARVKNKSKVTRPDDVFVCIPTFAVSERWVTIDDFSRTETDGWGIPSSGVPVVGQPWTTTGIVDSVFSVAGTGVIAGSGSTELGSAYLPIGGGTMEGDFTTAADGTTKLAWTWHLEGGLINDCQLQNITNTDVVFGVRNHPFDDELTLFFHQSSPHTIIYTVLGTSLPDGDYDIVIEVDWGTKVFTVTVDGTPYTFDASAYTLITSNVTFSIQTNMGYPDGSPELVGDFVTTYDDIAMWAKAVEAGGCSNGEPRVGQRVRETEAGDGSTTTFEPDFPYSTGSLRVFVNGLDWTPDANETDPDLPEYTLDYPIPDGATVVVEYRRAA